MTPCIRVDPGEERPFLPLRVRVCPYDGGIDAAEPVGYATASAVEALLALGAPTRVLVQVLGGPGYGVREVAADEVEALGVARPGGSTIDLSRRAPQQQRRSRAR